MAQHIRNDDLYFYKSVAMFFFYFAELSIFILFIAIVLFSYIVMRNNFEFKGLQFLLEFSLSLYY